MKGRKLLMIPGPIEFEPDVLAAMSVPTDSHISPDFIERYGHSLDMLTEVFLAPGSQPFVVAGSGTLAMDMAVVNLVEPGDKTLVVSSGYFGARFQDLFSRYGVQADLVSAPVGDFPTLEAVETALKTGGYKLMTVTHVDTSTGVRADIQSLAKLAQEYSALTVVDGVAATAGERMLQEEWGVDVYLTASQKAIGVPPGLALLVASPRAMDVFHARQTPVSNYYADFTNWLPIMQAYQARKPSYFGTPPVNTILALEVSLAQILAEGMPARFDRHARLGAAFRAAMGALGLDLVPVRADIAADTLSAVYYPEGVDASLLGEINKRGVILAGGLHPEIKTKYFRVGHMGSVDQSDLLGTIGAIEAGLQAVGYKFDPGAGLTAAQSALLAE
jgi:alanine-glyoxylate transaminase/serine-glyoxylate transaminase/serine-pyruvate transaminase